ncbi:hypothetical protein WH367_21840, partial [Comamonas sp. MYb21]
GSARHRRLAAPLRVGGRMVGDAAGLRGRDGVPAKGRMAGVRRRGLPPPRARPGRDHAQARGGRAG